MPETDNSTEDTVDYKKKFEELEAQYKSNQKALSKWEKRAKDAQTKLIDVTHNNATSRVEERMDNLSTILGEVFTEHKSKFESEKAAAAAKRTQDKTVAQYSDTLMKKLDDVGIDYYDESAAPVRSAWEKGRLDEAISLVDIAAKGNKEVPTDDLVARVRADVLKELGKVDTGESTSTAEKPKKLDELVATDISRMSLKEMTELKEKIKRSF